MFNHKNEFSYMSDVHLLFSDNTAWGLFNFRGRVIRHFLQAGARVSVCVPPDGVFVEKLRAMGCDVHTVPVDSHGMNPLRDLRLLWAYYRLMRRLRPDMSITYTVKPNVYGGLAAALAGVPYLPVVPGVGQVFIRRTFVTEIVRWLYKVAFRRAGEVWFLNGEDIELFRNERLVPQAKIRRLDGEGIDLSAFAVRDDEPSVRPFSFILTGRMLWEKGIRFYVEAARQVKAVRSDVRFLLLGMLDGDTSQVSRDDIEAWQREGIVEYLGAAADVVPILREADCVVLPSYYREGIPRSLMEGAAMGLPLITTDNTGCREVVADGVNGFLCRVKDAASLADAMVRMVDLPAARRREMGLAGRRLMEERFDVRHVIRQYDEAVERLARREKS